MCLSSFCCVSIMTHLHVSARVQMSSCLSLFKNGLSWIAKNGHCWHEHFRKLDLKRKPKVSLRYIPWRLVDTQKGIYNVCHWRSWFFSIKCAMKFCDVITAVVSDSRAETVLLDLLVPTLLFLVTTQRSAEGAPSIPQDFISFPPICTSIFCKEICILYVYLEFSKKENPV